MRWCIAVGLLVGTIGALGACSSGKTSNADLPETSASANPSVPSRRLLDAVLDDHGLHLPAGQIGAADYTVSFEDRRSHPPAKEAVTLRFRPTGPDITLLEVPAGESRDATLLSNVVAYVAINGADAHVPADHPLEIVTTPEYPVPAT